MKKRLHFWLVAMFLILASGIPYSVHAQNPQTIEVGPHFGVTSYIGELNVWRNLDQWQWKQMNQFNYDLGAVVRFNYDSRWSFRFDYTYARLRACDTAAAWRPEAMLNFRSSVHDFSLMVEFNFLNYYTGRVESSFSPYLFAGVSGFLFITRPFTRVAWIDDLPLNALDTDYVLDNKGAYVPAEKGNFSFSIPFGIGCKLSLSKHLAATVEWRMHYTFTDYLDDVSGVYASTGQHEILFSDTDGLGLVNGNPDNLDPGALSYDFSDPSGLFSGGQQRGNCQTNDWFGMINLSLTWKFVIPGSSACKMNFE